MMTDQSRKPSHAQLIQLQTWYRRICDLQVLKCNGSIRARIDTDTGNPDHSIALHSPATNRTLQLISVGGGWLIFAWREQRLDWQLNHSLEGEPMLRFIEHAALTYLVDAKPTRPSSTPPLDARPHSTLPVKRPNAH